VHSPDQAPQAYIDSFKTTASNLHRRTFAAMVRALDEGVANGILLVDLSLPTAVCGLRKVIVSCCSSRK